MSLRLFLASGGDHQGTSPKPIPGRSEKPLLSPPQKERTWPQSSPRHPAPRGVQRPRLYSPRGRCLGQSWLPPWGWEGRLRDPEPRGPMSQTRPPRHRGRQTRVSRPRHRVAPWGSRRVGVRSSRWGAPEPHQLRTRPRPPSPRRRQVLGSRSPGASSGKVSLAAALFTGLFCSPGAQSDPAAQPLKPDTRGGAVGRRAAGELRGAGRGSPYLRLRGLPQPPCSGPAPVRRLSLWQRAAPQADFTSAAPPPPAGRAGSFPGAAPLRSPEAARSDPPGLPRPFPPAPLTLYPDWEADTPRRLPR